MRKLLSCIYYSMHLITYHVRNNLSNGIRLDKELLHSISIYISHRVQKENT